MSELAHGDPLSVGRATLHVYTSPHATADLDPESALIALIAAARTSVLFGVYSFTLAAVSDTIIARHAAGLSVRGLGDAGEWAAKTSRFPALLAAGVDVRQWGSAYELMHLKAVVVDGHLVAWGSWNWTGQAEKANQEVMTVASSPRLAAVLAEQIQVAYAAGKVPA